MNYLYKDVRENVKKAIVDMHPYISDDKFTKYAVLSSTLDCDTYDVMEIIMRMEHKYNIQIKNIQPLKYAFYFGDLCDMFYNIANNQPLDMPVKHKTNIFSAVRNMFSKQRH